MVQVNYVQNKKNLSEIAYIRLKNDIFTNKIKPGDCLSENLIAKQFNMSRTPVREALRALASEDLVEIKDGIGVYVKTISIKDIEDIFQVRKALETLALKTSIHRITDYEVDALVKKFEDLITAYDNGINVEMDKFISTDWELDELMVKKCNNNYIISIIGQIKAKIIRYQYMSHEAFDDVKESTSQHLKILELIKKRDLKALIEANEKHIDWALECFFVNKY